MGLYLFRAARLTRVRASANVSQAKSPTCPAAVACSTGLTGRNRQSLGGTHNNKIHGDAALNLLFQQVLNGLTLGSIYGLVALGLTLVYGILHIPNFAHGALYMVGAFASYYFMTDIGLHYWIAMLASGVVVAVLAVLSERLVFHPLRNAPRRSP